MVQGVPHTSNAQVGVYLQMPPSPPGSPPHPRRHFAPERTPFLTPTPTHAPHTLDASQAQRAPPPLPHPRRHVAPDARKMAELLAIAKDNNVPVDTSSGAALQVRGSGVRPFTFIPPTVPHTIIPIHTSSGAALQVRGTTLCPFSFIPPTSPLTVDIHTSSDAVLQVKGSAMRNLDPPSPRDDATTGQPSRPASTVPRPRSRGDLHDAGNAADAAGTLLLHRADGRCHWVEVRVGGGGGEGGGEANADGAHWVEILVFFMRLI